MQKKKTDHRMMVIRWDMASVRAVCSKRSATERTSRYTHAIRQIRAERVCEPRALRRCGSESSIPQSKKRKQTIG